jgi:hypothetical protein
MGGVKLFHPPPVIPNERYRGGGLCWRRLNHRWREILISFILSHRTHGLPTGWQRHSRRHISILFGVWLVGMAGLMLGMDSLLHPPFFPHALFAGGYWAALCSVALVEEVGEWLSQRRRYQIRSVVAHRLP